MSEPLVSSRDRELEARAGIHADPVSQKGPTSLSLWLGCGLQGARVSYGQRYPKCYFPSVGYYLSYLANVHRHQDFKKPQL